MQLQDDLLHGAAAAAAFMGVSPRVVYNLVRGGNLPVIRKGRKLFFRRSLLERAFQTEISATATPQAARD